MVRWRTIVCLAALCSASGFPLARADDAAEIGVARAALRDGFYELARTHARKAAGEAAMRIVLESYAREGKWTNVVAEAAANASDPAVRLFRAAALLETGATNAAAEAVASMPSVGGKYGADLARLKADLLAEGGDLAGAVKTLEAVGGDPAADLVRAELLAAKGETAKARALQDGILAATNAPAYLRLAAAVALGDAASIRRFLPEVRSPILRARASLRLGVALLSDAATFAEGERTIRAVVQDTPDAPDARTAFLTLADALLDRGAAAEAEAAYRASMEMWPRAAHDAWVYAGIAWACSAAGRHEDALAAFRKAVAEATDDDRRALLSVKVGDELTELGRLDEAARQYRETQADYPKTEAGRKMAAVLKIREREQRGREAFAAYRFAEAREAFADVAKDDPARAGLMSYFDVMCLYGIGSDDEAEKRAREVLAAKPDPAVAARVALWLAKFLYNANRWKESEALFASVVDIPGVSPEASSESLLWAARAAFAAGDQTAAVAHATRLVKDFAAFPSAAEGMLVQGEALVELGRFDEAVLAFERVGGFAGVPDELRFRATMLRADAFFAMGADNAARYTEALEAYRELLRGAALTPSVRLRLAFKTGRTLDKLRRPAEASECLYVKVVLAYREGRLHGLVFDDEARAAFSRAAFLLADEAERRGHDSRAVNVLRLVESSDVPAAAEAARRIARIQKKGTFL